MCWCVIDGWLQPTCSSFVDTRYDRLLQLFLPVRRPSSFFRQSQSGNELTVVTHAFNTGWACVRLCGVLGWPASWGLCSSSRPVSVRWRSRAATTVHGLALNCIARVLNSCGAAGGGCRLAGMRARPTRQHNWATGRCCGQWSVWDERAQTSCWTLTIRARTPGVCPYPSRWI